MSCARCSEIFSSSVSWHRGTGDDDDRDCRDEPVVVGKDFDPDCGLCILFQKFRQENLKNLWPGESDDDYSLTQKVESLQNQTTSFDIMLSRAHDDYRGMHFISRANGVVRRFYKELISAEHISDRLNRDISPRTDSESSLNRAINWIRSCSDTHDICRIMSGRTNSRMPKRLLQVTNNIKSCNKVRLVEPVYTTESYHYATLSHCWGKGQTSRLLENTLDSFTSGVDERTLPKVYQDAISVTVRAGLSYIWVDSLCIIQDSVQDWLHESARMDGIYQNADLNIAATGFAGGEMGLFAERNEGAIFPVPITVAEDVLVNGRAVLRKGDYFITRLSGPNEWSHEVDESPLNRRAWVVQERMLSRKTIHFGTRQLYWECFEFEASEVYPCGFPRAMVVHNVKLRVPWLERLQWNDDYDDWGHERPYMDTESALAYWQVVVEAYSLGQLTFASDKMIALSGLASIMTEFLHGRYLAGIWEQNLLHQLVWYVRGPGASVGNTPRTEYRCPSWSWMSVDAPIHLRGNYPLFDDAKLASGTRVIDAQVQLENDANSFGRLQSGYLQLQGALRAFRSVRPAWRSGVDRTGEWADSNTVTVSPDYRYNLGPLEDLAPCKTCLEAEDPDLAVLFFLPVRTEKYMDESSVLSGLVLVPTSRDDGHKRDGRRPAGEFERIGLFETRFPGFLVGWTENTCAAIPERFYEKAHDQGIYTFTIV